MKPLKNSLLFLLSIAILLSVVGCSEKDNSSDDNHRPHYKKETQKTYVDKDGQFEYKSVKWSGPQGYTIVVPQNNASAMESAKLLQDYYGGISIVSDNSSPTEKEILIGKTNREESGKALAQTDLEVSVVGDKLVFNAEHDVTLDSAVKKYIRLAPKVGEAFAFKVTTDFKATVLDGYEYVWGDEFEGTKLDASKWALIAKMGGSTEVEVSKEKDVINVEDGRLKLHAIHYFNNDRQGTQYRVPCSVVTQKNMNFVYGYAEIRARIPFSKGVWASFWTQTTDELKGSRNKNYMLEVDIFEIFRGRNVSPNLIKWYSKEFDYNKRYNNVDGGRAVSKAWAPALDNPSAYIMEERDGLNYEYHTYGFEWTKTEMSMYIDGEKYTTFDTIKSYDLCDDQSGFHDPMFLILNNHVFIDGVSLADAPITNFPENLPGCYYIDYCRVYQKPGVGELYISEVDAKTFQ